MGVLDSSFFILVVITMNSIISELILTIFSLTLQLHIYFKEALKPEHFDTWHAGFYRFIFPPLLVCAGMFFTALILTMCLAIKNQKDEARRLQSSFQGSSLHI